MILPSWEKCRLKIGHTAFFFTVFLLSTQAQPVQIKGVIADDKGSSLPFAQIALFEGTDRSKAVSGTIADEDGEFLLRTQKKGSFLLTVFYLGYAEFTKPIELEEGMEMLDLGKLMLESSGQQLDEIEVSDERPFMTSSIDKKVFDVSQNLVSEGGTAIEAMQNIPSVSVDMDGGIQLRGSSNVTIWINGKPSALIGGDRGAFLDQLPASEIERVEVITNPSSKYDADGTGGIINIVLKKNRKAGTNGSVTSAVGSRNKTNQNVLLNHHRGKLNVGFSYSFNYQEMFRIRESQRTNFVRDSVFSFDQDGRTNNINRNHVGRLSLDYEINDKHSIGGTFGMGHRNRGSWEYQNFNFLDEDNDLTNFYQRRGEQGRISDNVEFSFYHRKDYEKQGREWVSEFSFSESRGDDGEFIVQETPGNFRPDGLADFYRENFLTDNTNRFITIQTDYVHPINDHSKWEAGAKTVIRQIETDFVRDTFNRGTAEFETDMNVSNAFAFTEAVHAAYFNYQGRWGKLGYQGGVRGEMAFTTSEQRTTEEEYPFNYYNLFPSAFLSYDFDKTSKLQASYTRRINRPSFGRLNPFLDVTDPLNYRQGNPFLRPEYYDSYEFGFEKYAKWGTVTTALYYRSTNNQITRFRRLIEDGITLTSFENLVQSNSVGLEAVYILSMGRKLNAQASFNYFYRTLRGENIQADLNNAGYSWTSRGNINYAPWDNWSFQLSFFYWGPGPTPQGRRASIYGVDAAVKRDIWNKKASISLRVSDIFDTREFGISIEDPTFINHFRFKRETQIAFLSFTYRFGSDDRNAKKRERKGRGGDGGGMEDDFDM